MISGPLNAPTLPSPDIGAHIYIYIYIYSDLAKVLLCSFFPSTHPSSKTWFVPPRGKEGYYRVVIGSRRSDISISILRYDFFFFFLFYEALSLSLSLRAIT